MLCVLTVEFDGPVGERVGQLAELAPQRGLELLARLLRQPCACARAAAAAVGA